MRRLDESFVVLHGGPTPRGGGAVAGAGPAGGAQSTLLSEGGVQRVPFDQKLRALARVYEVASEEGRVELPLCAECAAEAHRELEAQLAEVQQEVAAYEAALAALGAAEEGVQQQQGPVEEGEEEGQQQGQQGQPLDERQFERELQLATEEAHRER